MGKNFEEISIHDTPERSPGFLLWHLSTSWRSSIETILKPIGLTHPQFVVLATLGWLTRSGARVTQAALGKMAGLDPNTTSQIIKGLEQKGLIQREPSSDGRVKNPLLTAKGDDILGKALPAVETADAHFFNSLGQVEREHMVQIFQKILKLQKKEQTMEHSATERQEIKLVGICVRTSYEQELDKMKGNIFPCVRTYFHGALFEKIPHRVKPGTTFCAYTDYKNDHRGSILISLGKRSPLLRLLCLQDFRS